MKRKVFSIGLLVAVFLIGMPSVCLSKGEIRLMLPKIVVEESGMRKGEFRVAVRGSTSSVTTQTGAGYKGEEGGTAQVEYVETFLSDFAKRFRQDEYKVDQIELWIIGQAETGGITRLFVSLGGEGGCKVILRPREK